jgi:hypothetical protein
MAKVGVFLITIALIAGMVGCGSGGSYNPTPSQDLQIRTWYDLDAIRDNQAGNHTLMNNLDSTTAGYDELAGPTANGGNGWYPIDLYGILDGHGYEIRDLFCPVGLFGIVMAGGVIENLGVVNADITGSLEGAGHGFEGVGSLVGINYGTVNNSYSTGSVTGDSDVGGLVGRNWGTVSNSYYSGNVNGNTSVGGLVGYNFHGSVSNSYSNGTVTGYGDIGGLVGLNTDDGTASNSFWDIETSGQNASAGGTGKNTTEMQDIATFLGAGWNITAVAPNETNPAHIWNIINNATYPFLSWQSV